MRLLKPDDDRLMTPEEAYSRLDEQQQSVVQRMGLDLLNLIGLLVAYMDQTGEHVHLDMCPESGDVGVIRFKEDGGVEMLAQGDNLAELTMNFMAMAESTKPSQPGRMH